MEKISSSFTSIFQFYPILSYSDYISDFSKLKNRNSVCFHLISITTTTKKYTPVIENGNEVCVPRPFNNRPKLVRPLDSIFSKFGPVVMWPDQSLNIQFDVRKLFSFCDVRHVRSSILGQNVMFGNMLDIQCLEFSKFGILVFIPRLAMC